MTDEPSELLAAARHLAQWGRSRQTVWQDASSDLLAALGNRYASFDDLQSAAPPPPPPPAPRPHPVLPPPVFTPAPAPPPIVAAPPPPAVPVTPLAMPVKTPARNLAAAPPRRRPRARGAALVLAVAIVVAALASPAIWTAYEASRAVVPATNTVTIESTPPGSVVLIDGVESGKTPLSTSLVLGVHHVELRYRKNVRTLDVDVVAGDRIVTRVDWTKRPTAKKRPAPKSAAPSRGTTTITPKAAAPAPAAVRVAPPSGLPAGTVAAAPAAANDSPTADANPSEPTTPPATPQP